MAIMEQENLQTDWTYVCIFDVETMKKNGLSKSLQVDEKFAKKGETKLYEIKVQNFRKINAIVK